MIYREVGNSGVKISIIGMGRYEYLKSILRSLTPLKIKIVKTPSDECMVI